MIPLALWLALAAAPVKVERVSHAGHAFTVTTVDLTGSTVKLSWSGRGRRLPEVLAPQVLLATNAGIFEPGFVPTGLLVTDGATRTPLNAARGEGNFFLEPNGVFLVRADGGAAVVPTAAFKPEGVQQATQSGPLLVTAGALHPRFTAGSKNLAVRSGVGVREGVVVFAISDEPVNLHDFATLFRDALHCPDALYLDGTISELWARGLPLERVGRREFAGIVTVTQRGP